MMPSRHGYQLRVVSQHVAYLSGRCQMSTRQLICLFFTQMKRILILSRDEEKEAKSRGKKKKRTALFSIEFSLSNNVDE